MSKAAKILLLIGGVLAVTFVVIMSIYGWDFSAIGTSKYEMKSETVENNNQSIEIRDENTDIIVGASSDDKIHFVYYENESHYYDKQTEGNIFFKSNVNPTLAYSSPVHFELLLPEGYSGNLILYTANDNITITNVSYTDAQITTANDDIALSGVTCFGSSTLKSSNSDIDVKSSAFANITLETENDSIILEEVTSEGIVEARTINGDISVKNQTSSSLVLDNENSDIDIENVFAKDIQMSTVNGDIKGSISGSESEYSYTSTTKNGDNNLGDSIKQDAPNVLSVQSENGDVEITFEQ